MRRLLLLALLLFAALFSTQAQLCTGSLGDPIVRSTFGSGANPGPRLASAAPGYTYQASDCPGDGLYSVRNNTAGCFSSTWHSVASDHSGDPNGYFLLVNASNSPGDFYVDTVYGLCSGTTYEFAAWVLNVLKPASCNGNGIQPNITFRIERTDGTVLGTYNSGNIPPSATPEWKQYGFFFTTSATVSDVVVRMTNNAPGGCGNDLLLDDITFRACGPLLTPGFTAAPGLETNICAGTAASFDLTVAVSAGYVTPRFQWQESRNGGPWTDIAGATARNYAAAFPATTAPGNYRYRLTVAESANWGTAACTVASGPLTIHVIGRPALLVSNSGPACAGSSVSLNAGGASVYSWSGPSGYSAAGASVMTAPLQAAGAGTYTLQATDAFGCSWTATTDVVVLPRPVASVMQDTVAICAGADVLLAASGGGTYSWSPAAGLSALNSAAPRAAPADTSTYLVVVMNAEGCRDTAFVRVNVRPLPRVSAGPDAAIFLGDALRLEGSIVGNDYTFQWSPPYFLDDPSALQPTASPERDTAYVLTATSLAGCGMQRDTMRVRVFRKVEVPNVFTPNGDGVNDRWEIPALAAYRIYTVDVFSRWGQPLLSLKNRYVPWNGELDGKPLPVGTYYYVIRISDNDQLLRGWVDLLR
jgi:gliding motility-associated-like protein